MADGLNGGHHGQINWKVVAANPEEDFGYILDFQNRIKPQPRIKRSAIINYHRTRSSGELADPKNLDKSGERYEAERRQRTIVF
jgi:hypothetical protein